MREGRIAYDKDGYLWAFPNDISTKVPQKLEKLGPVKEFEYSYGVLAIKENGQLAIDNLGGEYRELPIYDVISIRNGIITTKSETYVAKTDENSGATRLSTEAFTTDLVKLELGEVITAPNYDVTGDGIVDINDLAAVAINYNENKNSINYNIKYDFNLDEIIDLYDMVIIAKVI